MSDSEKLSKALQVLSLSQIKDIAKKHNLHFHIKLSQKKDDLIKSIVKLYNEKELFKNEYKLKKSTLKL